ncbi:uncharacterized protein [Apostichopus japonicus]|uniref:uncharacterized protein isoform X2 n=1 Tax=Stichopus japonicus TaxID=307972 RepID=UPI003AB71D5A
MNKINSLDELLPNFEQFLEDLSSVKLTSDLERRLNTYRQRIKSHIEQHSPQPGNVPPKLPASNPPLLKRPNESDAAFTSRQRVIARETYSSSGGSIPVEEDNIYEDEDFYLEPSAQQPPPLPATDRPPLKSNTLGKNQQTKAVEESGQMYYDFERKGGETPVRIIDTHEDEETYQDVDDGSSIYGPEYNYDDDFSDSTDFEEVGEGGQVEATIQPKQKKSKFELFQEQYAEDAQVDMIGELFYCNMSATISKRLINKWVKKYCVARDMHLLCHNAPKKKSSTDIPLPGHTVKLMARSSGKKNVLVISHPSKGDQLFSCRSKEEAERWLEVLQDYATMGHEIVPNSGYVNTVESPNATKTKEKDKDKKKQKKKDKKKEKVLVVPELSYDDNGVLVGNVNLYGIHFGEPKWKKYWISIKEHTFNCHLEENGIILFSFDLRKTTIDLADDKESKDKTTLKIGDGEETYVLIEPLNMIDNGKLLKSLMSGITAGADPEVRQKQSGLVSRLMEAFEESQQEPSFYELSKLLKEYFASVKPDKIVKDCTQVCINNDSVVAGNVEELYLEVLADYCQSSRDRVVVHPSGKDTHPIPPEEAYLEVPSYNSTPVIRPRIGSLKLPTMNLRLGKTDRPGSAEVKTPENDPPPIPKSSGDKKSGSGSKSSTLSRFFSPKSTTLSPPPTDEGKSNEKSTPTPSPKASPKVKNKAKTNDEKKPDLILASKLSEERTAKEAIRKELNQKKKDIRMKKFTLKTDPERDACDQELRAIQAEWSEVNNSLLELEKKIYMAKAGIDDPEQLERSNSTDVSKSLPRSLNKRVSVANRASAYNRMSSIENGTIGDQGRISSGSVQNMKSLFQGN